MHHPDAGRFLTVPQVAEELATSEVLVIAMLRRGDIWSDSWRETLPA
jgi:hypothetical protein